MNQGMFGYSRPPGRDTRRPMADSVDGLAFAAAMLANQPYSFTITDYDKDRTYNLTTSNGTVTRSGATITYTPAVAGAGGFIINGRAVGGYTVTVATGQQAYTTAGTFSWVAPAGVTSVAVVTIGGGGAGGSNFYSEVSTGGGGGGLGYKNAIPVTPGNSYTGVVGIAGASGGGVTTSGGESYFISAATVRGAGGTRGAAGGTGGGFTGDGGGTGGAGGLGVLATNAGGGGGAAGYSGTGGVGAANSGAAGAGAGGGGGGGGGNVNANFGAASGGGVGILGSGANGAAGTHNADSPTGGGGGSGGTAGSNAEGSGNGVPAGPYGGGGGGNARSNGSGGGGGVGAVRIMWGINRSYPATNTANM